MGPAVERLVVKLGRVHVRPYLRRSRGKVEHVSDYTYFRGGPRLGDAAARRLAEEAAGGGFSYQPFTGTEPKRGYMVGGLVDPAEITVGSDRKAAAKAIARYVREHAEDFERDPNLYIGGWIDDRTGRLVIEVSENVEDRAGAVGRGTERNQVSIYDVAGGQTLDTHGSGEFRPSITRLREKVAAVTRGGG